MSFVVPSDWVSWVDYPEDSPFPIQNVPFGLAYHDERSTFAVAAIGEYVIDLVALHAHQIIELPEELAAYGVQTLFWPDALWMRPVRQRLIELLHEDHGELRDDEVLQSNAFLLQTDVEMRCPSHVPAYVDFYSGIHHASNVGRMFRPDQPPLLPNYRHIPIAYNGRASSVTHIHKEIKRPFGQTKGPHDESPAFGPTKELDFELEMGFILASTTDFGETIPIAEAEERIAGLVIVNDWSARDMQRWEYQPLGPFLAKTFATSVSPWVVTLDALTPFRVEGMAQDPAPLPYLAQSGLRHFDVQLEVTLKTAKTSRPQTICRSNMKNLYWSIAQQLAHQSSNGTPLQSGDLYASGTISGETPDSFGSLLELTWRGQNPILVQETGETRTFLEDGDTVTMTAFGQGDGYRIGFGEVSGTIAG
ncbi:MAG TPA: fumarylacetoacetase [Fimbriimonadaceae bacterium]|nr:fumarylacetoacetase [Fimbriimonadaceae bacterium]